ncbi:MAG: 2-C-methyl-D-erythritol 4-phosphate cytidylyltransferase [Candidatus Omnitrophica bacterium]|nr:2-C-methyl-D-erythritol 4-phosphate cytidylyltransferase [Candidatus Omnitrophota bacterium]
MYVSVVLLAAGRGLRFSPSPESGSFKPLVKINHKPTIIYSLETFNNHPLVNEVIIVINAHNCKRIINVITKYRFNKIKKFVEGGKRRQDSVYNGLQVVDKKSQFILIHDSARPFIGKREISAVINEAKKSKAAILGVPVKATIKKVEVKGLKAKGNFVVEKTLDRENLWEIQTPQVFDKELLLNAYKKFNKIDVTDDATLVEKLGHKVSVVLGSYRNIKITTPEDLATAEAILNSCAMYRV